MKHSIKKLSPTKVKLSITLDDTDLADIRPVTLAKLAKTLKVSGFRPGKVPVNVAEKHVDPTALESQLVEDAINRHVINLLNNEHFQALDRPQVDVVTFEPKQKLEFTAEVEILPTITLGDYKKLKATKVKPTVVEKDITDVIDRMRAGFAEKEDVDRAAKKGDEVWIDFDGTDEAGKAVPGASGKDYPLALGSDTFIPGFEAGLIGKKTDDEFDLPLTFPKDYHAKTLAGAKVNFKVKINHVKAVNLPKVDDDFAVKCGPFKTLVELKADIKRELMVQKESAELDKLKDSLIEQLVKISDVPAPESLIEDQMSHIERDTIQNLLYRGQTIEQYLDSQKMTRDEWRTQELRPAAERRVKVGLILAELSKAEKIDVTNQELETRQQATLEQYSDPNLRAQFDTADARRDLANRVMTEKTVDRLVQLNS
ncbi:MAG TPA: trigger factor [Candidatus Saccharimonadales bacterium]|jgi:trigger factor|nr:trigger factor [Candidatus Saccharimonadales bacterium]